MSDVEDRNQAVWNSWDMKNGSFQKERYSSQCRFLGWRTIPDVCHYTEHETTTKMGPLKVGPEEIGVICRNMNRRQKLGMATPLINRHSPAPNAKQEDPLIVGYTTNYRIGMIDDGEAQRYSIFGDEYHKPEHLQELNNKPRRSVELMRFKDSARNFFDPVACLGAESPRIEMPPAYYSIEHDEEGLEVVRYSIAVPVSAGASNTYLKTFGKERMQASAEPLTENLKMLDPADLQQVTDAMKAVLAPYLPALEQLANPQGQQPGMPGQMPGQPAQNQPGQPGGDQLALGGPHPGSQPAPAPHSPPASPPMAPPNVHKPAPVHYSAENEDEAESVKYSQLLESHQSLLGEHGQLKSQFGKLMAERTDAIRSHKLMQLANQYEGIVDFDDEASKVLYAAGSEMNDEEFEDYIATVEKYAAKAAPPTEMIPIGVAEDDEAESLPANMERYSQGVQTEVVRRMANDAKAEVSKYSSYEDCEMEVCRELKIVD